MGKYRYARSNGEFLPSRFVERAQSVNSEFFAVEQAYNLTKDFISGTQGDVNSFVSDQITGYTGKNLVGWWRLGNTSATGSISDSTGNGHTATFGAGYTSNTPALDSGDTPSTFVTAGSLLFRNSSGDFLEVADSPAFTFGNGARDVPFSTSGWIKNASDTSKAQYILAKYNESESSEYGEWYVSLGPSPSDRIKLYLRDSTTGGYRTMKTAAGTVTHGTWVHFVTTYDGRGGSAAHEGINIYINGTSASITSTQGGTYNAMSDTVRKIFIGAGSTSGTGHRSFDGNLAEIAVWNRELTSADAAHLYGVSSNGAFREVRNFDQVSPENDTRVLGVKSSTRGFNVSGFPADIMDGFRQGVNVVTFHQLLDYTSFKIRPESSFITTINGKDVSRRAFDESIAMTTFPSGTLSGSAYVSLGGEGRLSKRLSHERELRDLGQTDVYVNLDGYEAYEDTLDLDPVAIIGVDPDKLVLPRQLVVQTSDEMTDGAIEPLVIRSKIDNSGIEAPFFAHDFRASLGGMTDAYRKSMVLTYGWDLDEPGTGAPPFLDSVEVFAGSGSNRVDLPGAFSIDFAVTAPYIDYLNDRDREYTKNSVSTTISHILIVSSSFEDASIRTHDKMASAGFKFDNNPIGIDSIAFGGLKK